MPADPSAGSGTATGRPPADPCPRSRTVVGMCTRTTRPLPGQRPGSAPSGTAARTTAVPWNAAIQWAAPAAAVALLTGCASMPDESGVSKVSESPRADGDSQVRVFGVKPRPNDDALSLVRGFLEAITSDEADYRTARLYLTQQRAKSWDPFAGITVLTASPTPEGLPDRNNPDSLRVDLTGTRAGWVDKKHAYTPADGRFHATFRLAKEDGEWRIADLPDGLVLSHADFQRIYRSVNVYYFAASAPPGQNILVPDPVYLRRRIDPLTSAVQALLDGPTDWLSPVVASQFPRGTELADGGAGLELTDSGKLRVRLSEPRTPGQEQCERMAAQLLKTAQEQAATKVQQVELAHEDDSTACAVTGQDAERYGLQRLVPAAGQQFLIDEQHRLVALDAGEGPSRPVPGPFGLGKVQLGSAAVRLDGHAAAGVTSDGRSLYVTELGLSAELGAVRLKSDAERASERLSAPSWDGLGDLWVADRNPDAPRLVVLRGERTIEVQVPALDDRRIQSVRVAPDGARIALLIKEGGRTTLHLGRVERSRQGEQESIAVKQLRPIAPQLEDVGAASWAGLSRILVVGRESQGVQQMRYADTDGSMPYTRTLPGISKVEAVAASPDEDQPLLADSEDGIFRLPPDGNWRRVASEGSSPIYPG